MCLRYIAILPIHNNTYKLKTNVSDMQKVPIPESAFRYAVTKILHLSFVLPRWISWYKDFENEIVYQKVTCTLNMRTSPFKDKERIFDRRKNLKLKVQDALILTYVRFLLQLQLREYPLAICKAFH